MPAHGAGLERRRAAAEQDRRGRGLLLVGEELVLGQRRAAPGAPPTPSI